MQSVRSKKLTNLIRMMTRFYAHKTRTVRTERKSLTDQLHPNSTVTLANRSSLSVPRNPEQYPTNHEPAVSQLHSTNFILYTSKDPLNDPPLPSYYFSISTALHNRTPNETNENRPRYAGQNHVRPFSVATPCKWNKRG